MASEVDIINLALARLGVQKIDAVNENNTRARYSNAIYNPNREAVLRAHPWNFAKNEIFLALSAVDTVVGWDYVYIYPPDCLFVRKLFTESSTIDNPHQYVIQQSSVGKYKIIACNLNNARIEYTVNEKDTTLFDATFIDALAWKLASELAQPLIGDINKGIQFLQLYEMVLGKAMKLNRSENHYNPKNNLTPSLVSARG